MKKKNLLSRRSTLKGIGAIGASALLGSNIAGGAKPAKKSSAPATCLNDVRKQIFKKVLQTPFIDTHEHLVDESVRLAGKTPRFKQDGWSIVFSHYLRSDMVACGMPKHNMDMFFSRTVKPVDKWRFLKPYWPAIKHTGYGQAVAITIKELYGIDEFSDETAKKLQPQYEKIRKPGFYKYILKDRANIESCQVNSGEPFRKSDMPDFLMQDISIVAMFALKGFSNHAKPAGIKVKNLGNWHRVIDWWFNEYAKYAVAVKSQNAYSRDINYEDVSAETAEPIFDKARNRGSLTPQEEKILEDHLFWYAVRKATEHKLPVKLHTGYYAGQNKMPLSRLINNAGSATDLCRISPETNFVFMHICYPYYEEMISVIKQYTNAIADMCWAWIINPVGAKDFLKKFIVTAPTNKILTFGGDYSIVEPVLGHAAIARRGIALALSELVEEGWITLDDALELTDPIMHGNARRIFNLAEKEKVLKNVKWG